MQQNGVYKYIWNMRIIAGRFKGLRLASPRSKGVRPTADRVREALFSILGNAVEESRVLDLFAGTGAFGFEALSRGALFAVFVDKDRQVVNALHRNTETLGIAEQVRILNLNASTAMKKLAEETEKFEIIFLDPPYNSDWINKVALDPVLPNVLQSGGLLVIERDSKHGTLQAPSWFEKRFSRKYGGTLVEIFQFGSDLT
jgi:16S rRNA (guanine966-N2)-methyltransferase